jgi:hypothetical protein
MDYNLYCKFWALQDFFRNPNQCYSKVHWKTFSAVSEKYFLECDAYLLLLLQDKVLLPFVVLYSGVPTVITPEFQFDSCKTPF